EKLSGPLRGGLLADRMGFGKTSVAIGLTSLNVKPPTLPGFKDARCGYIPSSATLIMCPSHLLDQWQEEFWKFLGSGGVEISEVVDSNSGYREMVMRFRTKELPEEGGCRFGIEVAGDGVQGASITHIYPAAAKRLAKLCKGNVPCVGDRIKKVHCTHVAPYEEDEWTQNLTVSAVAKVKTFINYKPGHRPPRPSPQERNLMAALTDESVVTITFRIRPTDQQRTAVTRGSGPLKVLVIRASNEMNWLQQQDILRFHVVLASTGIHADQRYASYVTDAAKSIKSKVHVMAKKVGALPDLVTAKSRDKNSFDMLLRRTPALFELTRWHRVILDEFHESEAWEYRVREMLRGLTAVHKWGLSGTPPLDSAAAVAEIAGLLGYASADKSEEADVIAQALHWGSFSARGDFPFSCPEMQQKLQTASEKFVAGFIRQNTSALVEQIGIQEHEVLIEHTAEERLIYRQACHDRGVFDLADGYTQISLE
ncbi:SHPRH, partial [Symbiodinium pilosum]